MKFTFYIKYKQSYATVIEKYNKKSLADKRFNELMKNGKEEGVKCFWFERDNKPEERTKINFDGD